MSRWQFDTNAGPVVTIHAPNVEVAQSVVERQIPLLRRTDLEPRWLERNGWHVVEVVDRGGEVVHAAAFREHPAEVSERTPGRAPCSLCNATGCSECGGTGLEPILETCCAGFHAEPGPTGAIVESHDRDCPTAAVMFERKRDPQDDGVW